MPIILVARVVRVGRHYRRLKSGVPAMKSADKIKRVNKLKGDIADDKGFIN